MMTKRGEIILAPMHPFYWKPGEEKAREEEIPRDEDYILTMADISQVRLQAKLVVLSSVATAQVDASVPRELLELLMRSWDLVHVQCWWHCGP